MKVVLGQFQGIDNTPGLPLAAGCLVATARADPRLRGLDFEIVVDRAPVDRVVHALGRPDVLGFSLYPWNAAYSLEVARVARAALPDTLIVAGGPSVPRRPESTRRLMAAHPELDCVVLSEGEVAFRELLDRRRRDVDFADVAGLAFRVDGDVEATEPPARIRDLSETASPYLDGTFDELVAAGRDRFSIALVETNRGCPFTCTFCDWSLTRHVYEFPLERVESELEWIARNGFSHICICDANFGIRPRDREIAHFVADRRRETGQPSYCYFYLTKNNARRNLETIEILHGAGIDCCVGLAVQDFDDDVLEAVRRDNIQTGESMRLRDICAERGIPTLNELIFGLPRQTFESFTRTVTEAMPPYPRHAFGIFQCRLLDNTELASPQTRAEFGIETRTCRWIARDTSRDSVVEETQELVVGTSDMPIPEWARTYRFVYLASAAYNLRLLRIVLQYVRAAGVDIAAYLADFADAARDAAPGSALAAVDRILDDYVDSILSNGAFTLPSALVGSTPLPPEEAVTAAALARADEFFDEAEAHAARYFARVGADAALLPELFRYQRLVTPRFGRGDALAGEFDHDWPAFAESRRADPPSALQQLIRFVPPTYATVADFGTFVTAYVACSFAHVHLGEVIAEPAPRLARAMTPV